MKLKTQLRESGLERLLEIAQYWDLAPGQNGHRSAESEIEAADNSESLADYLYPRMQAPAHFKMAFERLEAPQRTLIYFLAMHGGELPIDEIRHRCGFKNCEELHEI